MLGAQVDATADIEILHVAGPDSLPMLSAIAADEGESVAAEVRSALAMSAPIPADDERSRHSPRAAGRSPHRLDRLRAKSAYPVHARSSGRTHRVSCG